MAGPEAIVKDSIVFLVICIVAELRGILLLWINTVGQVILDGLIDGSSTVVKLLLCEEFFAAFQLCVLVFHCFIVDAII